MRHLKRFNESLDKEPLIVKVFKDELKDFCETNLAYLLDDDVRVCVDSLTSIVVRIVFDQNKTWDEVKDQIIPFLIRLNNKYEIEKFFSKKEIKVFLDYEIGADNPHGFSSGEDFYSVKDLINDKTELDGEKLLGLLFNVEGYKQEKKSILTKINSFFK